MGGMRLPEWIPNGVLAVCLALAAAAGVRAQGHVPAPPAAPAPVLAPAAPAAEVPRHRFADRQNAWLFAGVAAARTLDYFSTLNMRRRGRHEMLLTDEVVDNHAAFAAIEAAGTAVTLGAAYLFHRYGHHRLERWTSRIHIGLATGGAIRNYALQSAHPAPLPPGP